MMKRMSSKMSATWGVSSTFRRVAMVENGKPLE